MTHSPETGATDRAYTDSATQLETRGIELVLPSERHGRARDLFAVWAAPNLSVLNFTIGATMILLGLEIWQAVLVIFASCLLWVLPGIVAVSGPAAGTSGSVIQRAIYGIHGNRIVIAIFGWFISGVFLALNWVASAFMGAELATRWGSIDKTTAAIIVAIVVSAITVLVAVYGHGLILRAYNYVTVALLVIFLVVTAFVLPHVDWSFAQPEPLHGVGLWSAISIGFAILASTPLSYSNSADLARYLPKETKPSHIVAATALGGAIPCFFFTVVGALLVTGVTSMDAGIDYALLDLLPAWLGPILVIGVVVNTVALNGMTTYTASMAFQSIGVPMKRIPSAILIGVLGTAFTIYLVRSTSLLDAVNLMLQFLLVISAPTMAVYVTDIVLRRANYHGEDLFNEAKGGPFWFTHGFGLAGIIAVVLGGVATAMFLSTEVWTGRLSIAIGYIDLSVPAGLLVPAGIYALLAGKRIRQEIAS